MNKEQVRLRALRAGWRLRRPWEDAFLTAGGDTRLNSRREDAPTPQRHNPSPATRQDTSVRVGGGFDSSAPPGGLTLRAPLRSVHEASPNGFIHGDW